MADIFISYKRSERQQVEKIATSLREAGFDVWFDARLEVGRDEVFQSQMEREVTSAGCVLVCGSQEAIRPAGVEYNQIRQIAINIYPSR